VSSRDDELLAELLEGMLSPPPGQPARSLEDMVAAHPRLERELRELWATVQIAEEFASVESLQNLEVSLDPAVPGDFEPRDCGDFELLEELGRGGMGIVYRARQKRLDRVVALKMILRGDLASPADLARFRAEAEAAAQLHHPHIVPVYEVGEIDGRPYFSMKLVEGTTLARTLLDGPLASRTAAEMLAPICRAIADAHRRGVLHRDLKPSNILIDRDGHTFVTDFGLAKRVKTDLDDRSHGLQSLTQSGAILGTPSYMAPEQAAGHRGEVNAASDIYSLGAILYAMLTGRPPFQAETAVDTVLMVLEQEAVPPRMLNPRVDPDLEMIALKCLQKPQDLRYSSADDLARDLEAYLANEPISARSSHLSQIITRAFRETHHAAVLENWGLLWMWHSLVVFLLCLLTNYMQWQQVSGRLPFAALWGVGVGAWAMIFWELRRRSGPITFVERQIAHLWAGSSFSSMLLFGIEALLELPVLTLSPVLPLIAGNVFLAKAGVLSGKFYVQAFVLYLTAFVMAVRTAS